MKVFAPSLSNFPKLNGWISLHSSLIWTLQVISNTHSIEKVEMAFFWYYSYTHLNKKSQVVLKVYVNWFNSWCNESSVMGEKSRPMESVRKRREMILLPTPHQDCLPPSHHMPQKLNWVHTGNEKKDKYLNVSTKKLIWCPSTEATISKLSLKFWGARNLETGHTHRETKA